MKLLKSASFLLVLSSARMCYSGRLRYHVVSSSIIRKPKFSVQFGDATFVVPYEDNVLVSDILEHIEKQWNFCYSLPKGKFWLHHNFVYFVTPEDANKPVTQTILRSDMTVQLDFLGPNFVRGLREYQPKEEEKEKKVEEIENKAEGNEKKEEENEQKQEERQKKSIELSKLFGADETDKDNPEIFHSLYLPTYLPVNKIVPKDGKPLLNVLWACDLYDGIKNNKAFRQEIANKLPSLIEEALTKDKGEFTKTCLKLSEEVFEIRRKMNDPNDAEGQHRMQTINQLKKSVEAKKEFELDNPERSELIKPYVYVEINGVRKVALIDTGAFACMMSSSVARACELELDIDTAHKSAAFNVAGAETVTGLIHFCELKIKGKIYPVPMLVKKIESYDFLLGGPFFNLHEVVIDTRSNKMTMGNGEEIEFLSYDQYIKHVEENINYSLDFVVDEELLQKLVNMGFDRVKAMTALYAHCNLYENALRELIAEQNIVK